jgi:hypothetical protein
LPGNDTDIWERVSGVGKRYFEKRPEKTMKKKYMNKPMHHYAMALKGKPGRLIMSYRNKTYVIFDGDTICGLMPS